MINRDFVNRRSFMRGLVATLAACWLSTTSIRQSMAQTARAIKPKLNPEAVNARIPSPEHREEFRREIEAARRDLRRYLLTHFTLTKAQMDNLKRIPPEALRELNAALGTALEKALSVKVRSDCGKECACKFAFKTRIEEDSLIILTG
jgi:hypothetical protein